MKFRTLLLGLSALFVAFNAAFFSVTGLAKLFAGASVSVMIMASSLEAAKLITAGYLYNYWEKINKAFRVYLSIGVMILVLITSLGIYGFLTAAFQDTLNVYNVTSKQKAFLEQKEKFWGDDVARYDEELKRISQNIATLSNAKASAIQVRDTTSTTGFRQTISTTELRLSQKRIDVEEQNRASVQAKREQVADSLQKYQLAILDLENNTEVAGELGPLEYLSGLTGTPMDKIINILLLVIIFVFDPLAISLVVAANFAFDMANRKNLYNEYEDDKDDPWYNDDPDDDPDDEPTGPTLAEKIDEEFDISEWDSEAAEKRMNVIGQNGNEGEHYEEDWKVVHDEKPEEKKVTRILQKGPSKNRVQFEDGSQGFV